MEGVNMPKEGFESITIPKELNDDVAKFVEDSKGIVSNKSKAITEAWRFYEKMFLDEKKPSPVKIANKLIGHDQPIFIIAEIGINHNGDLDLCKKMIDMAVETGCDAVKFQKRDPDICVPEDQKGINRETPWGIMTYLEYRKKIEFGKEEFDEINNYCKEKGILWFASAWDKNSIDFLEQYDVPCYKVASACLTDKLLLEKLKEIGKPIILSTGMSTIEQISRAVRLVGENNLIILHCTSTYPAKDGELNLKMIKTLRKYFNCPVGYSGHEVGVYPSIAAAVLGACVIERHITLDRAMYGSDQAASLEKKGLSIISKECNSIYNYLGDGRKIVYESEKKPMDKLRRVDNL